MNTRWFESGKDPDYRFSLANERTFLAWIRTTLAILAGAILLHQIQTGIQPMRWFSVASGCVAIFSTVVAIGAYVRWRSNELAMRHERSLPQSALIPFMTVVVSLTAAATAAVYFFA